MSTRSSVTFIAESDNSSISFYHHWDGYPTGVGLELFNFINNKGEDWHYYKIYNGELKPIDQHGLFNVTRELPRSYEKIDEKEVFSTGEDYHYTVIFHKIQTEGDPIYQQPYITLKVKKYSNDDKGWSETVGAQWTAVNYGKEIAASLNSVKLAN